MVSDIGLLNCYHHLHHIFPNIFIIHIIVLSWSKDFKNTDQNAFFYFINELVFALWLNTHAPKSYKVFYCPAQPLTHTAVGTGWKCQDVFTRVIWKVTLVQQTAQLFLWVFISVFLEGLTGDRMSTSGYHWFVPHQFLCCNLFWFGEQAQQFIKGMT